ncbi:non-canonical purine NTP diphosphatase [Antarcticibacterium sp. 1MA-6-2]|uniref:non-canonical purine NTP diphosphatase n=1 Tax=Antarcticibacterium sp. 1MA-6-2 TaxID=2908210 RepID=UPI001F3B4790|nr:non-canonical purine NTP diphosphatase [Antarcticibacterium sp. 1MA-6-2]UJH91463.1 non-canonical purine NTP diphosphatase [Antarcticibacterium sp. 1MA-6-2]
MKLVFATHNQNKLKEVQALMPASIELLSLDDICCYEEIPETADTIDENAILKADFVKNNYNMDCFADDTGLEVTVLNGAPGVYSARYAGGDKNNENNINKLLKELDGVKDRSAQFKTVIALNLNDHQFMFLGVCKGTITTERRGSEGFGYDAVFQPEGYEKTFAEMTLEEKSKISHRGIALQDLIEYLSK